MKIGKEFTIFTNSVLSENQQDKLADILFSVKETVTDFDWRAMRDHPDKMDEWLSIYKESQLVVKNQVNEFLDEVQYKEFEKRLQSKFKRYEGWISKQKKKTKSK